MISKKLVFSLFTIPCAILCHENGEWQRRRKEEKEHELKRRNEGLSQDPIDLTPKDGKFAFNGLSSEEIEDKYGFRRVKIKGVLDPENEIQVATTHKGERGYWIVNPLYTHVDENKKPCGILVNRGFLSIDYAGLQHHHLVNQDGYFEGMIYTGDKQTKYDFASNSPIYGKWTRLIPDEMALAAGLQNRHEAGAAMLMLVEFDEDHQVIMPSAPTVSALSDWKNKPERHNAYQLFWKYTTYLNLFANTMFWLYF